MGTAVVEDMIQKFSAFTGKPVKYLTVQRDLKEDIKNLVKTLYDYTKCQEKSGKSKKGALSELIVNEFDEEQIWQQIELQNSERWDEFVSEVANCMSGKTDLNFPVKLSQPQSEDELQSSEEDNIKTEKVDSKKSKKSQEISKSKKLKPKTKTSVVDDQFFNLQEMQKFLLKEEKSEGKADTTKSGDSDEESIDMFDDIDDEASDEEEKDVRDMTYSDFFDGDNGEDQAESDYEMEDENDINEDDISEEENTVKSKKKEKRVRFAAKEPEESDNSDLESDKMETSENVTNKDTITNEKKSEFELRQQRLQQQISRLEEKTLTEAPWQLKGEVDATKRPQNSLLEEVVDFDLTTRPAPIITEQTTLTLEDIITRRIKDKAWDDVIRKEKPIDDQLVFKKPEILDHNKSKQSLAQVYEAEYLKQKQAQSGTNDEEKEPESHREIRDAMRKLFAKLDALCHYHYTPKPPQAEVKIISNTPAISMEEVAPVATSEAALLAPEEVKKKHRGDLMSKAERTQTDKNRERRKKKKQQKLKGKVTKVTEHRNTTKGVVANDKAVKTSKAFFQQLNDDTTSKIKPKPTRNVKNKGN